jgi:hypothetical protein
MELRSHRQRVYLKWWRGPTEAYSNHHRVSLPLPVTRDFQLPPEERPYPEHFCENAFGRGDCF